MVSSCQSSLAIVSIRMDATLYKQPTNLCYTADRAAMLSDLHLQEISSNLAKGCNRIRMLRFLLANKSSKLGSALALQEHKPVQKLFRKIYLIQNLSCWKR